MPYLDTRVYVHVYVCSNNPVLQYCNTYSVLESTGSMLYRSVLILENIKTFIIIAISISMWPLSENTRTSSTRVHTCIDNTYTRVHYLLDWGSLE